MNRDLSFGQLLKEHRRTLGLTQAELAARVGCATVTLRKIEGDALRPSVQIAERLAMALTIPLEERGDFVRFARAAALHTPEPPAIPTPPPLPEEIGIEDLSGCAVRGYDLGERIGSGGFGAVYRAVQPGVEREVAVKIILPQYANHPDFIRRFEAEAHLVARLEHPHIVPLYDYWREPDAAYLVMRLLRGGCLTDPLKNGPLPLDFFLRILGQIGAALHTAHRFGVIHRDLKPANILLDEDQNAYLADFGIAKNLGSPNLEDQTQAGAFIGSPAYISPEQIRSESILPQADIYCLGVMMYELLTGRQPFKGPTPIDYIMQHLNEPLPSLAEYNPHAPAAFNPIIQRATAKNPQDRYPDIPSLLSAVREALPGAAGAMDALPWQEAGLTGDIDPTGIESPFKGLRPFGEADADDFFGRAALIQDLLGRLAEDGELTPFLGVAGPSGSGKSSVVRAGLIPAIRRGALPGSENWFIVDFIPGAHPLEELEAALLRIAVNPPDSLLNQLREDARGLVRAIKRILPADPAVELVLVIDQFEEVFTLVQDEAARAHFLESLLAAVLDERSRLHIIATLRADFTDRPLQYVDFGELFRQRTEFVLPLTPDEIELAITAPAKKAGLLLEPGLTARIVRELGDQPGTLPLLQYALTELFERRDGRKLTLAAYDAIGGVLGALGRRAEETYAALDEAGQASARQLFLRLVTLGEGVEDTRRRVLRAEVATLIPSPSPSQGEGSLAPSPLRGEGRGEGGFPAVMDAFGLARLLTFDTDPVTRGPTVEVAHEALLREWPRLRAWLTDSRADVRLQRLLGQAAAEWGNAGRDAGLLLRGTRLTQLDTWAKETTLALTNDERAFLDASLDARRARQSAEAERQAREAKLKHRVQRVLQALVGVLLLAAVISGGLAYWANGQRVRAEEAGQEALRQASIGLAAQARLELDGASPERSVLLALEALENYPYTWQAEQALGQIVREFRLRHILTGHKDTVLDAAWSPDGTRFATTGKDGTLRIWDAETRAELLNMSAHLAFDAGFTLGVRELAWSPEGTRIATAALEGTAKVWDATTGKEIITFSGHTDEVWGIGWSPDGTWVASASKDGTAKVWNAVTGEEKFTLSKHTGWVKMVAWSPNGTRIATASDDGTARIWDAETGEERLLLSGHTNWVWSVAWSPDGTRIATASEDGTVRVWDPATGEELSDIRLASPVWQAVWSPNGLQLATTNAAGLAQVWDVSSGTQAFALQGRTSAPFDIAWSPDGKSLATTAGPDFSVRIWDASPATLTLSGAQEGIQWVSWSPDGKRIATTALDKTAVIWDAQTGKPLLTFVGHTDWVQDVFWSPDGSKIVTTGWDNLAKVWDANTGEELLTFTGHVGEPWGKFNNRDSLFGGGWSPDGTRISTVGGSATQRIWDARTGEEYLSFRVTSDVGTAGRWSPDGTRLATCSVPQVLQIWDAATGDPILGGYVDNTADLSFGDHVDFCLANHWSPDGDRILTTSWGGNGATIWNAETGEKTLVFTEHIGGLTFPAWSPNGQRVATGDANGVVKVWDAETGAVLLSFSVPVGDFLFQLDWSPDGTRLTGVGVLASVEIYRVWQSTEDLISYTRECCVVRELASEERQQFGLPPAPAAGSAPSDGRVVGVMPLVFALLAALPSAVLIVRQKRRRAS